jgi:hypothetical protein
LAGIKLPTYPASSDPNTFDSYIESTWTPQFRATSGSFASLTYSTQLGVYHRHAGLVSFCIKLVVNEVDTTGADGGLYIDLPFNTGASLLFPCQVFYEKLDWDSVNYDTMQAYGWDGMIYFGLLKDNADASGIPATALRAGTIVHAAGFFLKT